MARRTTRRGLLAAGAAGAASAAGCLSVGNLLGDGADDAFASASFRGGLRRRGYVPDATIPDEVTTDWRVPEVNVGDHTASKASAVPTPDGDLVVAGDGGEVRLVTPDGEVEWTAETAATDRGIHATPAIANGTAYVGAYDGALYAFDLSDGSRRWRTHLGSALGGSPAYHEGTLYVAVEFADPSGSLFAVDAASGTVDYEDDRVTDHPHSTPGIDRDAGTLSIGSNDGYLYTWEYPDLAFAWRFDAGGAVKAPIAVHDGAAFFGSWGAAVFRVNLADGTEDWRFEAGDRVMSGVGIDPEAGVAYVGCHDGNVYALDAATGEERWRFPTGGLVTGCPAVTGDRVVVGSYDGNVYALEAASGDEVWRVENEGQISCEPLVHDGAIYYTERAPEDGGDGGAYRLVPDE
jgi:outer membrane protein assembly factor BamB